MKEIELRGNNGKGKFLLVDDEDYDLVAQYAWYISPKGYVFHKTRKTKMILVSRLIMEAQSGEQVDHIDGDKLNNQKYNLRICSPAENCQNRKKFQKENNSSTYKGVSWDKYRDKWRVVIIANGRKYVIGRFDDEMEAALAYDDAARKYHGEFANTNF